MLLLLMAKEYTDLRLKASLEEAVSRTRKTMMFLCAPTVNKLWLNISMMMMMVMMMMMMIDDDDDDDGDNDDDDDDDNNDGDDG